MCWILGGHRAAPGELRTYTGLTKVGLPGAPESMKEEDLTIAMLLKAQGYMTGQFGKNHLGNRDEHLLTAHGFDEFFGSLYHLNTEDEPEHPLVPAQQFVGQFLATFREFPPRQKTGSFSLDAVLESLQTGAQGGAK
jgi:arylsulfatase A-like enzyme